MTRLLLILPLALAACSKDRGPDAVAAYPDLYLCQLEGGQEKIENDYERRAVEGEIARRGLECYRGTIKTDSPLFR
ncbi:MAG: hypothetical protein JXQ91_12620 [Vannielia sp.]|uniref:hypothetical protein n=1 Tax=Rhodobacterales TaxID=204455 RepID=UPI0020940C3E|nr:hypothetical protein [Oceanicola sp. 502str15]MCO6383969.1 hypothetical protein [Oceanicola sp. 502str15]